jgi:hypothetical protein
MTIRFSGRGVAILAVCERSCASATNPVALHSERGYRQLCAASAHSNESMHEGTADHVDHRNSNASAALLLPANLLQWQIVSSSLATINRCGLLGSD